eukprot:16438080-Heterocapsa_arctica.AAC.1
MGAATERRAQPQESNDSTSRVANGKSAAEPAEPAEPDRPVREHDTGHRPGQDPPAECTEEPADDRAEQPGVVGDPEPGVLRGGEQPARKGLLPAGKGKQKGKDHQQGWNIYEQQQRRQLHVVREGSEAILTYWDQRQEAQSDFQVRLNFVYDPTNSNINMGREEQGEPQCKPTPKSIDYRSDDRIDMLARLLIGQGDIAAEQDNLPRGYKVSEDHRET